MGRLFEASDNVLQGPLGPTSSWKDSLNLCQWTGVTCSHRHPRVTKLDLRSKSIGGFLSPFVGNPSFVRVIVLATNSFYGEIPNESDYRTTPTFHWKSFSSAAILDWRVQIGRLTDSILHSFSIASNLEILNLSENRFTGKLEYNQLVGTIPDTTGELRNLQAPDLSENNLNGIIPDSFGNLTLLNHVPLGFSNLQGELRLPISGIIPLKMTYLDNIYAFGLEYNQLTGTIPYTIVLNSLWLGFNNLQGNIPSSFGNCKNLMLLNVSNNKLTGTSSPQLLEITTLSILLGLSDNLFSGSIPPKVGNLKTIIHLDISRNRFSGEIPTTLSACAGLQYLTMMGNSFSGKIPSSLISLEA
ncbi:hypothetical protein WN943_023494 [Citrus x changshan-huyou]